MTVNSLVAGCVAVVLSCAASLALAHAHPTDSDPAPNAVLSSAPSRVSIDFDEQIEPAFSSIVLVDVHGKPAEDVKSVVDPSNPKLMTLATAGLRPGFYTVKWVALAIDGHRTQGQFFFKLK